jgi:hypothetical protein
LYAYIKMCITADLPDPTQQSLLIESQYYLEMGALNPDIRSRFQRKRTSASAGGYPPSEWAARQPALPEGFFFKKKEKENPAPSA